MKKFSFMALALGLFLAAGNAMAGGAPSGLQDSTWLANDNVMSKTVGQPNSGAPLGAIISWGSGGMPADASNWRECDGQSLAGTALCKRLGICRAPNYRGSVLYEQSATAEPSTNFNVSIAGGDAPNHVDGISKIYIGSVGLSTWAPNMHNDKQANGTVKAKLNKVAKTRYLIKVN